MSAATSDDPTNPANVSRIRWDADGTSESHLVDVRVPLDVDDGRTRELKLPVLRFPIECFTPIWWDASGKRGESSAERVAEYFGLRELVKRWDADFDKQKRRAELRKNLQPIDRGRPVSYRDVARHFRAAIDAATIKPHGDDGTPGGPELLVHPLKLLLAAHEMNRMPLWSASEQDGFALVSDKLALAPTLRPWNQGEKLSRHDAATRPTGSRSTPALRLPVFPVHVKQIPLEARWDSRRMAI